MDRVGVHELHRFISWLAAMAFALRKYALYRNILCSFHTFSFVSLSFPEWPTDPQLMEASTAVLQAHGQLAHEMRTRLKGKPQAEAGGLHITEDNEC